jgi:hypothetical protein
VDGSGLVRDIVCTSAFRLVVHGELEHVFCSLYTCYIISNDNNYHIGYPRRDYILLCIRRNRLLCSDDAV